MRRGLLTASALVATAILCAIVLTACGGSSDSASRTPGPGDLRRLLKHDLDAELARHGASERVIACVDRNIEATSEVKIARRFVMSAPPRRESMAESLGPFGKGCF